MGSTNKTAHYELPQFVANDKPSWLGDVNEAMEAIDTGIYGAKSSADGAQQTANNAVAGVQSAGTRMDGIQTQLETVATQANQTATTVAGHTSSIATNSANINTLNARMGSTDISAIGDGTVTGAIDAIAEGGGGSTGVQLIAQGTAGGTLGSQAAELKTAFNALTDVQKQRAYIVRGTTIFICADAISTAPVFTQTQVPSASTTSIASIILDGHYYASVNGTITEYSTTVESGSLKLYA